MKSIPVIIFALLIGQYALADGNAEYKYREGVMKTIGGQMASLAGILRGQVHLDNLKFHARGMAGLAEIVPQIFPQGSGVNKSHALPAIWENPDEFKMAVDKFVAAANGMAAAAEGGDMSALGSAMKALGESCKGCHDDYRKEHEH